MMCLGDITRVRRILTIADLIAALTIADCKGSQVCRTPWPTSEASRIPRRVPRAHISIGIDDCPRDERNHIPWKSARRDETVTSIQRVFWALWRYQNVPQEWHCTFFFTSRLHNDNHYKVFPNRMKNGSPLPPRMDTWMALYVLWHVPLYNKECNLAYHFFRLDIPSLNKKLDVTQLVRIRNPVLAYVPLYSVNM